MADISKDEKIDMAKRQLNVEDGTSVIISADDELLASLGYRSELKREFSYWTTFGQSFGAMGIAPAIVCFHHKCISLGSTLTHSRPSL
jgi:hypothetical protein